MSDDVRREQSWPVISSSAWGDAKVAVAIEVQQDGTAKVAISFCNPKDHFSKKRGRGIALGRLKGNNPRCLIWKGTVGKPADEAVFKPLRHFIIPVTKIVHAVTERSMNRGIDGKMFRDTNLEDIVCDIQDLILEDLVVEPDDQLVNEALAYYQDLSSKRCEVIAGV